MMCIISLLDSLRFTIGMMVSYGLLTVGFPFINRKASIFLRNRYSKIEIFYYFALSTKKRMPLGTEFIILE